MKAVDVLNKHHLKRTSCREGILEVIMSAGEALSEHEIKERLEGNYDRTTFYRSFKTLEENKIIHKIVVDSHLVKYALDKSITNMQEHAHFYCQECDTVLCMEQIGIKTEGLPAGYSSDETEVIIKGTCAKCKETVN